jgi:hypothetical protein
MKFANDDDKRLFLLEIERFDLLPEVDAKWTPSADLVELFIQRRKGLINNLKDFRKSQNAKQAWRTNRYKMMKGIKKFHKSTKGKQMHRSLGRFLATRFTGDKEAISTKGIIAQGRESEALSLDQVLEVLKALSSLRTHIYIEAEYYMPISEYVEFLEFVEDVLEASFTMERNLLRFDDNHTEQDIDIIIRAIDEDILVDEIRKITKQPFDQCKTDFERLIGTATRSYVDVIKAL